MSLNPHVTAEDLREIADMPDDMLLQNIRAAEHVMAHPEDFPRASLDRTAGRWLEMCATAIGRALPGVCEP